MIGLELQLIEESSRLADPPVRMIENRCPDCGEGWFVGHIDSQHVAWGISRCKPCIRKRRIDVARRRLAWTFKRTGDERLVELEQRLLLATEPRP